MLFPFYQIFFYDHNMILDTILYFSTNVAMLNITYGEYKTIVPTQIELMA